MHLNVLWPGHLNGHEWEIEWQAYRDKRLSFEMVTQLGVSCYNEFLNYCVWAAEMSQSKTASSDCLSWRTESCCKDLNIKVFRSFSPTFREFQIRELVCQSCAREKKTPKEYAEYFICGLQRKEQTSTKESASSTRYFSCYTLDNAKILEREQRER